jgi:quinol monooxygenase YgiN
VSEIQGVGRLTFHDGKLEEFKRLSAQGMEIVRAKDTGTLQFEIYLSDDQSEGIVLERYRDSEALGERGTNFGQLGQAILATGVASSVLLGEPSADLSAILSGGPVRVYALPGDVDTARIATAVRNGRRSGSPGFDDYASPARGR